MANAWMEEAALGFINNQRLSFLLRSRFFYHGVTVKVHKTTGIAWLTVMLVSAPDGVRMRIFCRPIDYGIGFRDFMKAVVSGLQCVLAERFRIHYMVSGR